MICSSVCRFRVMGPSCGPHLSTGELPSQWSSFRGEGQYDRNLYLVRVLSAVFKNLSSTQDPRSRFFQGFDVSFLRFKNKSFRFAQSIRVNILIPSWISLDSSARSHRSLLTHWPAAAEEAAYRVARDCR